MTNEIILTAVGDISLGDSPKSLGFGVKSKIKSKGADFIFENIKSQLKGDIVFGNLETVLSERGLKLYDFYSEQLRGATEYASAISNAGFTLLSVANNHAMQHGAESFWESVNSLKSNNISAVGVKAKAPYHSLLNIINVKRKKIGVLSYSLEKDQYVVMDKVQYAYCYSSEDICHDIKMATNEVDWLVVSIHWGQEFIPKPAPGTVLLAHKIIESGADIILGHHPHVVQGVEKYKHGVICYSLGNFVFDMAWNPTCQKSMIARFQLRENAINSQFIPVIINKEYQPVENCSKTCEKFKDELLSMMPKYNFQKGQSLNHIVSTYRKKYWILQKLDLLFSNLFFFFTLFTRTPMEFLPGKIKYFLKKFTF